VSPFVAYLLSSDCNITGQAFLVGGGLVQRVAPWSLDPEWTLQCEERWTLSGLAEAVAAVAEPTNAGRLTGIIP
jgi:hypothetical protein